MEQWNGIGYAAEDIPAGAFVEAEFSKGRVRVRPGTTREPDDLAYDVDPLVTPDRHPPQAWHDAGLCLRRQGSRPADEPTDSAPDLDELFAPYGWQSLGWADAPVLDERDLVPDAFRRMHRSDEVPWLPNSTRFVIYIRRPFDDISTLDRDHAVHPFTD